jgi:hypothetical protein
MLHPFQVLSSLPTNNKLTTMHSRNSYALIDPFRVQLVCYDLHCYIKLNANNHVLSIVAIAKRNKESSRKRTNISKKVNNPSPENLMYLIAHMCYNIYFLS